MSAEADALTVVNQLRDLAADPLNRRAIVEDQGCLPGLILFLDHPNPQVVYSALLVSGILFLCFIILSTYIHKYLQFDLESIYSSTMSERQITQRNIIIKISTHLV